MSALSPTARHEYYVELGNGLPPPVVPSDKNRELRINTAIEAFDVLRPGDAYEGLLAVQIVLSGAHAIEIMREAGCYRDDFAKLKCCRAQAAGMMRAAASAKRTLEREQKGRLAVEAVARTAPAQPAATMAARPPSAATPAAPQPPVLDAAATGAVRPAAAMPRPAVIQAAPQPAKDASAPPISPEATDKAEAFAADNLEVAVRIRHDRGVTQQCRAQFRAVKLPTDPALIDALVRGTSTLLSLLDDFGSEELDAAD